MFQLLGVAISLMVGVVFLQREEGLLGSRFVECWKWYRRWSWTYHNLLQPGAARVDLLYVRQKGYEHEVMYVRECVLRQYTLFWACGRLVDAFCGWVRVFTRIGGLILGGVVIFGAVLVWCHIDVEKVACNAWARHFTAVVMILVAIWGFALITTLMYYRTCAELLLQHVRKEACAYETPEKMLQSLGVAFGDFPKLDDWLGMPGERPPRRTWWKLLARAKHRSQRTFSWLWKGKWYGLEEADLTEVAEFLLPWRPVPPLLELRRFDGPRVREIVRRLMSLPRDVAPEAVQWIEDHAVRIFARGPIPRSAPGKLTREKGGRK